MKRSINAAVLPAPEGPARTYVVSPTAVVTEQVAQEVACITIVVVSAEHLGE